MRACAAALGRLPFQCCRSAAPAPARSVADAVTRWTTRAEAELARLGQPAVGVRDVAQLAGQAELAEAPRAACRPPSAMPFAADASASAIARSAPGSSTRTPPATLTNTSAVPSRDAARGGPARRARAPAGCGRPRWRPAAAAPARSAPPAPGPPRAAAASPPSRRARREPGARVASPTKRARGVLDLHEPAVAHLEHAHLVGGAEAVLERAQRAVGALALALELQHAVDQVLEHARAGQRALLGHVAHEQRRRCRAPWPAASAGRRPRAPGRPSPARAGQAGGVERLHRVDDADLGPLGLQRGEHGVEVRLGDDRARSQRVRPEPLGAQLDLRRRLLAGDVEHRCAPRPRGCRARTEVSVDLPIPGEPPISTSEPGTRPPPSTRSSSPMPVVQPREPSAPGRRASAHRRERPAGARAPRAARAGRRRGPLLLGERVPLAAAGAAAVPLGALVPAGGAGEDGG